MITSGDITYKNKRALRGKFNQQGGFRYSSLLRRPKQAQLRLFERIWRQDTTIKSAVTSRTLWLLNTIGEVEHPDPEIAEFHNRNIKQLEEENGASWVSRLQTMQETKAWSGFSVSEIMFDLKFGSLYLNDLITYHPSTISIYPDKKGRLVEGRPTFDNFHSSGLWQYATGYGADFKEKQLSLWKHIHLANESDYSNYYGISLLEPSYVWYRLKEALLDMMAAGLDNEGRRLIWVRMPSYSIGETRVNPSTGEEEAINSLQLVKEQFDASDGVPEVLYLPFQNQDNKPEIGSESIQDSVGDAYMRAIEYADAQSIKHIIPAYLVSSAADLDQEPNVRERQLEMFSNNIEVERSLLISALIKKVFMPIQSWNFNRASAKIPPTFARRYSDRAEDRLATMQTVKGLTENGWLNPFNDIDYIKVMQMLRLDPRERSSEDASYIYDMLIEPRQKKDPRDSDVGPKGSGSSGRSTGNTSKQIAKKEPKKS